MTTETALAPPKPKPEAKPGSGPLTAHEVVLRAESVYVLASSTEGNLVAYPRNPRDARIAREVKSLRPILTRQIAEEGRLVSRDTMSAAIDILLAKAEAAREERVYLRSAEVGRSLHLDLAHREGASAFVEVSASGWEIRDPFAENSGTDARPIFRRTAPTKALPTPTSGGSRDDLRRVLGLEADDERWLLIWGWLVASLFESAPRPILWVLGPQGSGKSTRARMILSVIEPCESLGRPPGENERDDATSARGRYLPSWDNVGTIGAKTSDWLCRLVTGVEIDRRALYSDDDLRTTLLRRSGVATSIVLPYGLGGDALERLVLLDFERMAETDRRPESVLWADFHDVHAGILGALLSDVAGVLAHLGNLKTPYVGKGESPTPRSLPRMADYALILAALDEHLVTEPQTLAELAVLAAFEARRTDRSPEAEATYAAAEAHAARMEKRGNVSPGYFAAYAASVTDVLAERANDDPLTAALVKVARSATDGTWKGTAEALNLRVSKMRPDDLKAPWPTGARSLGHAIERGSETFRAAGLIVGRSKANGVRVITLALKDGAPETPVDQSAAADEAPVLHLVLRSGGQGR